MIIHAPIYEAIQQVRDALERAAVIIGSDMDDEGSDAHTFPTARDLVASIVENSEYAAALVRASEAPALTAELMLVIQSAVEAAHGAPEDVTR